MSLHLPRTAALTTGRGGQPLLLVDSPASRLEVYLHGATVTAFQPARQRPVLFTSRRAVFDGRSAIGGGVPVCTPWFGTGPGGPVPYKHGWARLQPWEVVSVSQEGSGSTTAVRVVLRLRHDSLEMLYELLASQTLSLALSVRNAGTRPRTVEAALHHYLAVGDLTSVQITGLEGRTYRDMLPRTQGGDDGAAPHLQDGTVRLTGPTDRIYLLGDAEVPDSSEVRLMDPAWGRSVHVHGDQASACVVWTPWSQGAAAMEDLGDDEWPRFVCVETARIRDHAPLLEPGESLSLSSSLSVTPLN